MGVHFVWGFLETFRAFWVAPQPEDWEIRALGEI